MICLAVWDLNRAISLSSLSLRATRCRWFSRMTYAYSWKPSSIRNRNESSTIFAVSGRVNTGIHCSTVHVMKCGAVISPNLYLLRPICFSEGVPVNLTGSQAPLGNPYSVKVNSGVRSHAEHRSEMRIYALLFILAPTLCVGASIGHHLTGRGSHAERGNQTEGGTRSRDPPSSFVHVPLYSPANALLSSRPPRIFSLPSHALLSSLAPMLRVGASTGVPFSSFPPLCVGTPSHFLQFLFVPTRSGGARGDVVRIHLFFIELPPLFLRWHRPVGFVWFGFR